MPPECESLADLPAAERALFECPAVPVDPLYLERFSRRFRGAVRQNSSVQMKRACCG